MFLNRLTIEEKDAFLWLAHYTSRADGNFVKSEELIIAKYCLEMQMDDIEFNISEFKLEEVLGRFSSESHQKIVLLELMALIYADNQLVREEEELLNQIVNQWLLNPNLVIVYKEWAKSILSLFTQGEALIHL
jgi:hypothetical protein